MLRMINIGWTLLALLGVAPSAQEDAPVNWPLNQAVIAHDLARMNALLAERRSQDELDFALIAAAGKGWPEAALLLLASGANPNRQVAPTGPSSVIVAIRENQLETLEVLLKGGGDPNGTDQVGWRPLHHTVGPDYERPEAIRALVQHGAVVDGRDGLQRTALHRAAGFGHAESVRVLLTLGADASLRDKYGNTAGERAEREGHRSVVRLIQLPGGTAQQISETDLAQYRDEEYRFSIHYPRSWARTEATHAQTRFKVVSDGGAGTDDLSVVVTTMPGSKNITPEEFLNSIDTDAYLAYVQQNFPGTKLIDHGPTTLSNQAAYYFVMDLTHRVLGLEIPMRQIQVQTVRNRNVYTVTFRTDADRLPESLKEFVLITVGFVLWPEPPNVEVVGMSVQAPDYMNVPAAALGAGLFTLLLIGLFVLGAAFLRFALIGRAVSKLAGLGVVAPVWMALLWLHHQSGNPGTPPWISAGAVSAWFLLTSAKNSEKRTSAQSDDSDRSTSSSPDAP